MALRKRLARIEEQLTELRDTVVYRNWQIPCFFQEENNATENVHQEAARQILQILVEHHIRISEISSVFSEAHSLAMLQLAQECPGAKTTGRTPNHKKMMCAAVHLACYEYCLQKGIITDFTSPCRICDYSQECRDINSHENLVWLYQMAGLYVSYRQIGKAITKMDV